MSSKFHQLSVKSPQGVFISMGDFDGKVLLIVNTATKCGLAPQFDGLEVLHQRYKDNGLVVLGFPSDQFAGQEPETNESMEQTCKLNHGVTFQLLEKCDVNGPTTHPVFKFLKKELGGFLGSRIKWNFTKFLVDKNGIPFKRYAPITKPQDIEKDIIYLLQS
ncbi:glutathione peroxidase [Sphingobacterium pedocola]|uniref:Glutathione peroxidase n=1 Tax=Sphingobacterium pedocola TaxID=2082722 RepID=A0ABR9T7I2_9SPHI|nr:glutathione peroxidase [Sphingobacterium pedocola]MBE8721303.1 glutathione peroxidase [Sphingobacterium pedocola]